MAVTDPFLSFEKVTDKKERFNKIVLGGWTFDLAEFKDSKLH